MSKLPTSRLPVTPSKTANAPKSSIRPPQQTSANTTTPQQTSPNTGDSANNPLNVGDRIITNGKNGTIAFIGPTKFAEGEWLGIILDEAQGKNDGSYEGTRYFETEPNRGLFCRPAKAQRIAQNGATASGGDTSGTTKAQATPQTDAPKPSTTTTTTTQLDKDDTDKTVVNPPSTDATNTTQSDQTVASAAEASSQELRVGDRVVVSGTKFGTLKYLGKIHVADGTWCGIQLDEPLGKNDGSVSGKRYFTCQQRYGLFSPVARVEKVTNEMSQSQIIARKASVSSSTNNNRPLHRSNSQESLQSNTSEFSASSNSISRIPTRTPAKMQQQKQVVNPNLYTPTNTKTLLTQAAATLAAATPTSTQIANLVQTIRDRELFIEKLQSQREQDRLEFSRAAQQVDEMESRLLASNQRCDIKEAENEQLKKEQYQTQQRIEDLEFQLEEYKLTDANKDHSAPTAIPEGHRLLSPKDIEIYEAIKEKVLELETVNQKLILEKQTLQDEHRQELKRQNESIENDYKSRLTDLEQKQNNNQTESIDAIKSEYQTKLNEKDQQITKISEQKQQEIDQLKSQLSDLQTKEQTQSTSLSEKDASHQQSIKELQEIRSQLTTLQAEKGDKEKQVNDLLVELKRYQENLLPELEKQCQTLKSELTEFQNQDQAAKSAVTQMESQYQEQIKEYQSNITHAIEGTDKLRAELKQFQEENLLKEKQSQDLINSLKHENEKIQTELKHRELQANSTLNEREAQYEQQIKDYQSQLEQSTQNIQTIQSELTKLQEGKASNEKTISSLKQDYEKLQNELQERERTQNTALNERESQYESQIKEYQTKGEQANREIQDLRTALEEKNTKEKQSNDSTNSLKQDLETLKTQITTLESQNQTKTNELTESKTKLDQLTQQNNDLRQQLEGKTNQFQKESNDKQNTFTQQSEALKKELQDLQTKYSELQTECQKHLTSNEQLKNTNDNIVNEKQALIDQLTAQINDLQQSQAELIEKQVKQHADLVQQQTENQKTQEKSFKDKVEDYEKQIQSIKSEFSTETENLKVAHEQEKLLLKKALEEQSHNKVDSGNVKQLEAELTEARYQIEKLKKQVETSAVKEDETSLTSQVNFLNGVIVELQNANEGLKKEIEFLKNPYAGDDEYSQTMSTHVKSSAPRLYCDMCEVFDQHDTDDCPKQSSLVDDQPPADHQSRERVLPAPRPYCEKCEEFGHDCDADETF